MKRNLLALLFIAILSLLFLHPISGDGDFFHHLETGRYVINNHTLPRVDEWTYTARGLPWIAHSWGMGVVFYLIYNHFGPAGISVTVYLVGFVTLLLLCKLLLNLGITQKTTLLLLPISAATLSVRFPSRPEIVTFPLTLLLLDRYKEKFPKIVILIPIITFVWANFYGAGALWGIILIILLIGKEFVKDGFRFKRNSLLFYSFAVLAIFTSFVNGYGINSIFYLKNIQKIGPMQSEWAGIADILRSAPSDYLLAFQYLVLIFFIFLLSFLIVFLFSIKRVFRYPFLVLLSGSLILPFVVFRYTPLAVILSAPLIGVLLKDQSKLLRRILFSLLILTGAVSIVISLNINPVAVSQKNDNFPEEVVEFIKNNGISGRAYNNQRIGAFLSYFLYPKILIFVDTRDELFLPTNVFADYMNIFSRGTSVLPLLEKNKVDLVIGDYLTEGRSYEPLFYSNYWAIVYINDRYFVAVPRQIAISKHLMIYDAIDPFSVSGAKPGEEASAQREYEKAFAGSESLENQIMMIRIFMAQKKYEQAAILVNRLKTNGFIDNLITEVSRDGILAQIYIETKDCVNTKKYLSKLDQDTSRKYIFTPTKKSPSESSSGFAFYYLVCERDYARAKYFLDKYLSSPYVSQLEKIKTIDRFKNLGVK